MKSKRIFSFMLAAVMLLSMSLCGSGMAFAADEGTDIDAQLTLIFSQIGNLLQTNGELTWYYTVTDLDHNGRLEFIAAAQHPQDRSTNLKIWEVTADKTALTQDSVNKREEESFPDILTDSCDTYHDLASDSWFYLFYDNVVLSANEVFTSKSAYRLKDGAIGYLAYAIEHTVVENGYRTVSHMDQNGNAIAPDQYNAAGVNAFAGCDRSSTNFDWFASEDASSMSRLADSYAVFAGRKNAIQSFPVPKPAALNAPVATAAPAPTTAPAATATPAPASTAPTYLSITKNPTNENRNEGGTALFVSCANAFDSLTWTMVSPNGGEYSVQSFAAMYPNASVTGQSSTTLSVANLAADMNNWGAYCTFYYRGQTARTSTAYMYVTKNQQRTVPSGSYSGTVTDWSFSTVTVQVQGVNAVIPWGLCDVDGDLYYGAPASVYWTGSEISYCYIRGSYTPTPVYGSMSGTAYEGGGGYAINLSNGSQVYVDSWKCNVSGIFYDGASCVVYYENYASSDNIYSVDIYGANEWDVPYTTYDDRINNIINGGGWAGSNYYDDDYDDFPIYGGWAGSNYYDDYDYSFDYDYDQGGYAGSSTVMCPNCYSQVASAYDNCPYCGYSLW